MIWKPEELKKYIAALPDDVKDEIIYGVAWDMFGDIEDDGDTEYIDDARKPSAEDLHEAVGWFHEELTKERPELKVKEVIRNGELEIEPGHTIPEIMEMAAACLDRACSWDICGEVLFLGDDDRHYVGTVEFTVGLANPKYLEDVQAQDAGDVEED